MNQINTSEVYPICDILNAYEDVQVQVKKLFEQFIRDKSIPLDDRWAIFVNSPDSLKNHICSDYSWSTEAIDNETILQFAQEEEVSTVDYLNYLLDGFGEVNMISSGITPEMVSQEKEVILLKNLASYIYRM